MKKITFIIIIFLSFFVIKNDIYALEKSNTILDNTSYVYEIKDKNDINSFSVYLDDNKLLYSLDPDKEVLNNQYDIDTDYSKLNLSLSELCYIKEIIYFGYGYNGNTDIKYFFAGQELIWEFVSGYEINWYEIKGKDFLEVNLETQKEEIKKYISNSKILPSFSEEIFVGGLNTTSTIIDENNIIEEFVSNDKNIKIENNSININFIELGHHISSIIRKFSQNYETYIYTTSNSQTFIYSEGIFPINIYLSYQTVLEKGVLNVKSIGQKIIDFKDEFVLEEKNIPKVEYKIYAFENIYDINNNLIYKQNDEVLTFETNEKGEFSTELYFGRYYIKQSKGKDNYILNDNSVWFILDGEKNITMKLKYGNFNIRLIKYVEKVDDKLISNFVVKNNVEFGLYLNEDLVINESLTLKKDSLLKKYVTDNTGKIDINVLLPLGKYYIREITKIDNYKENLKKYEFETNSSQTQIKLERIINYLNRYNVIISNYESCDMNCNSNNEFALYKNKTYIKNIKTDENGIINLDNLVNGNYKLIDISDLSQYSFNINNEDLNIEIITKNDCKEKEYIEDKNEVEKDNDEPNQKENIEDDKLGTDDNSEIKSDEIADDNGEIKLDDIVEDKEEIKSDDNNDEIKTEEENKNDNYLDYEMPETYGENKENNNLIILNLIMIGLFVYFKNEI